MPSNVIGISYLVISPFVVSLILHFILRTLKPALLFALTGALVTFSYHFVLFKDSQAEALGPLPIILVWAYASFISWLTSGYIKNLNP